jgi:hypothetical protein
LLRRIQEKLNGLFIGPSITEQGSTQPTAERDFGFIFLQHVGQAAYLRGILDR